MAWACAVHKDPREGARRGHQFVSVNCLYNLIYCNLYDGPLASWTWAMPCFVPGDFNDGKRNLRGERFRVMVAETSQECSSWTD